jgi:hypothetical protein
LKTFKEELHTMKNFKQGAEVEAEEIKIKLLILKVSQEKLP